MKEERHKESIQKDRAVKQAPWLRGSRSQPGAELLGPQLLGIS